MNIPFTRNGKLDDTYDTKDSVYTLYTKITTSGANFSTSGIYLDKELTKEVSSNNPITDKEFLNYLYSGKVIIEAVLMNGAADNSYWRSAVVSFFSVIGLNKFTTNATGAEYYAYTIKAASGLDASTGTGLTALASYDIYISAN